MESAEVVIAGGGVMGCALVQILSPLSNGRFGRGELVAERNI